MYKHEVINSKLPTNLASSQLKLYLYLYLSTVKTLSIYLYLHLRWRDTILMRFMTLQVAISF